MTATTPAKLSRNIEKRTEQLRERFAAAGLTLLHADPPSKNSNPARYPLRFVDSERERWDLLAGHLQYHTVYVYGPEKLEALTADPVLLARVCGMKRHYTYEAALDAVSRPSGWVASLSKELKVAKTEYGEAAATLFVLTQEFGADTPGVMTAKRELARAERGLLAALAPVKAKDALLAVVAPVPEVPEGGWAEVYDYLRGY